MSTNNGNSNVAHVAADFHAYKMVVKVPIKVWLRFPCSNFLADLTDSVPASTSLRSRLGVNQVNQPVFPNRRNSCRQGNDVRVLHTAVGKVVFIHKAVELKGRLNTVTIFQLRVFSVTTLEKQHKREVKVRRRGGERPLLAGLGRCETEETHSVLPSQEANLRTGPNEDEAPSPRWKVNLRTGPNKDELRAVVAVRGSCQGFLHSVCINT